MSVCHLDTYPILAMDFSEELILEIKYGRAGVENGVTANNNKGISECSPAFEPSLCPAAHPKQAVRLGEPCKITI
eukprot:1389313-Amorphochlora_amoeboformis.AAC.2